MAAHKNKAAVWAEYVAVTRAFADQMVVATIHFQIIQIAPALHDDGLFIARLRMRRNAATGPKSGQPGSGMAVVVQHLHVDAGCEIEPAAFVRTNDKQPWSFLDRFFTAHAVDT